VEAAASAGAGVGADAAGSGAGMVVGFGVWAVSGRAGWTGSGALAAVRSGMKVRRTFRFEATCSSPVRAFQRKGCSITRIWVAPFTRIRGESSTVSPGRKPLTASGAASAGRGSPSGSSGRTTRGTLTPLVEVQASLITSARTVPPAGTSTSMPATGSSGRPGPRVRAQPSTRTWSRLPWGPAILRTVWAGVLSSMTMPLAPLDSTRRPTLWPWRAGAPAMSAARPVRVKTVRRTVIGPPPRRWRPAPAQGGRADSPA